MMIGLLKQMLLRATPPVLRSNSPDRPMTMRRRHWFLQETKFLFLTRKGPVELTVKPALIIGGAFVGLVGMGVITATTLFLGFKSVEVVSKETISPARANATLNRPLSVPIETLADPENSVASAAVAHAWPPSLAATKDAPTLDTAQVIARQTSPTATAANLAEPDRMIPVPETGDLAPSDMTSSVALTNLPKDGGTTRKTDAGSNLPELIDIPDPEFRETDALGQLAFNQLGAMPATASFLNAPIVQGANTLDPGMNPNNPSGAPILSTPPLENVAMRTPAPAPEQDAGPMEPLVLDRNLPVVTAESREKKLLRSMASEVRSIRTSLGGLGLLDETMPEAGSLDTYVESADFASLAMAVEDHRSMLRKIPLKPPMLYFYISSEYGYRMHPVLKKKTFHHGIDLAGTWQEDIQASAPGTVVFAGTKGSFGKVVQVRHEYGIFTTYAHLAKISVRKGADVVAGTVVGKMGRTGRVKGAHLHYEIRIGDKSVNPRAFFDIGHRIGVGGELMRASDDS